MYPHRKIKGGSNWAIDGITGLWSGRGEPIPFGTHHSLCVLNNGEFTVLSHAERVKKYCFFIKHDLYFFIVFKPLSFIIKFPRAD
jgi:hypothetical protein